MIALTIAFFFFALLCGLAMRQEPQKGTVLNTLVFDPLILIVSGLALVFALLRIAPAKNGPAFRKRRTVIRIVCLGFMVAFWTGAAMYYFGVLESPYHTPGNDFAWNGYLDLLGLKVMDTDTPTYYSWWKNIIALLLFAVQPAFFWLGYRLGFTIGGFRDFSLWTRPKR
ncbi:hypothetical protein HYT45_02290 [Candidatus Uhrbacteria bacterium]|nr:hypothetical protein [Candidatus Uhrbacteria bacterium]